MAKPEPAIFDEIDEQAETAADERADADIAAGRTIDHETMKAWLLSWGQPDELPLPAVKP